MTITAEQRDLLNNRSGSVNNKVQLGTLIANAEAVTASEVALADGTVLIGNASGAAASKSLSGAITITREGVATLGADAVASAANVADDAVSVEHLDSGIKPSHVVKFAGKFTTLGGDADESISVAGVVATDVVLASLQDKGGTPRTLLTAKAGTDAIALVFSGDPSTDHVVCYTVLRAAS